MRRIKIAYKYGISVFKTLKIRHLEPAVQGFKRVQITPRVKIDGIVSDETYTTYGVPQGSVLDPTLFLVYINNIRTLNLYNTRTFYYADDKALVFSGESWDEVKTVAENVLSTDWLRCNLVTYYQKSFH